MKKKKTVAADQKDVAGEMGANGVADTGTNGISREIIDSSKKLVKNEKANIARAENKMREVLMKQIRDEKKELEKLLKETKSCLYGTKNQSQRETDEILETGKRMGLALTPKDARMIKRELKSLTAAGSQNSMAHALKTMEQRVGKRGTIFILMSVIWIIKAACPMPANASAYQVKAKALATIQTADAAGYFSPAFSGLALLITNTSDLFDAIEAFEADDGTGSSEAVEAAVALVKISIDLLVAYVNKLCLADQTNASAIIAAAGMKEVHKKPKNVKPDFSIEQGATGEVKLTSLAGKFGGKRVATNYYWQYGLKAGITMTWINLPDTVNRCKTTATGMPIDTVVFFRKATRTARGGLSPWSAPIAISPK